LHRRPDHSRNRTVHGDGIGLVQPNERRAEFHPHAAGAQRHHNGGRLCADRRTVARVVLDHGAMDALFLSVLLYIVVPLIAARLWRRSLLAQGGEAAVTETLRTLQPISLVALLATLVLLFGFQGEQIVRQPPIV